MLPPITFSYGFGIGFLKAGIIAIYKEEAKSGLWASLPFEKLDTRRKIIIPNVLNFTISEFHG